MDHRETVYERARRIYRSLVPLRYRKPIGAARGRLWYWIQMAQHFPDPTLRHMRRRLADLRGRYAGERCFIMGNGPSLNKMQLELFENEFVWGSNRCYLLFDRIAWRPAFYVAVDTRVVPDIAHEIGELQAQLNATQFFFPVFYRLRGILHNSHNTFWYPQRPLIEDDDPFHAFSTDATRGVYGVRTVTVAALQLAVHLGFNPIYLIGCDTSYSLPLTVRYEDGNPDHLVSTRDDDPNHFDPRYFGAGRRWHEPHVDRMIDHYERAKRASDTIGVEVYNATVGGKLEVFPRVDYRSLLAKGRGC